MKMKSKGLYNGYKSYDYLSKEDFKRYRLVDEVKRVESRQIPLTNSEEDRVQEILDKYVTVSLHDHPFVLPENLNEVHEYIRGNRVFTGYYGMSQSGLSCVFDGLLNSFNLINSNYPWKWNSVISELGMKLCDIEHQNYAIRASKIEDIKSAHENGNLAIVPTLEGAAMIENELDRIDILYGLGIRCMGLVYSDSNSLGSGLKEKTDGGLTNFGYEAVDRFNKVGMIIDLAHASDRTSLEAIEASKKPVMITHAGCRKIWNTARMKPDNVLTALRDNDGVIGIEAAPHTTISEKHPLHNIDSVMDHFKYAVDLIGIDHVGFGPDTMFGDHVGMHKTFSKELGIKEATSSVSHEEVNYVDGLENPSQFINIIKYLIHDGYSDDEIKKVVGGNAMRVIKHNWPR